MAMARLSENILLLYDDLMTLIITFYLNKHLEKYQIQANGHANGQSNGHSNGLNGHTIVEDSESESEAEEVKGTHRYLKLENSPEEGTNAME